jgi:large subunit ribosomal protein L10
MNLEQKKAAVEDLKGLLQSAQAMFLLSQNGLSMGITTQIRNALRKEGAGFRVVKNTMLARAVDGTPWAYFADWLKGPLAMAYTESDPVGLAKAMAAFLKTTKGIEMVGGAIGTRQASVKDMETLASLPAPDVIKGMLLGAMTGVPKKFLGLLQAPARDFLGVLAARERQLGEQG